MIDLHAHSTASDGSDSPTEVVRLAAAAGLEALALTDHDTLEHITEARRAAAAADVRLVPGCEISCELAGRAPGSLHLLVYFVEDEPGPLQDHLVSLQEARSTRNVKIVAALRGYGMDITLDEVLEEAGGGSVGRPHLAAVMMRKGYVESIQEAFDLWLADGKPAYIERDRLDVAEAISLARASGGVTSVAHPFSLQLRGDQLDAFVRELTELGLDALECEYGRYSVEERAELRAIAAGNRIAATGGSDYHGTYKPDLSIGTGTGDLRVPDSLLDALDAIEARRRR
jgi:predicted metal-dependent phosphoesterase TrpH